MFYYIIEALVVTAITFLMVVMLYMGITDASFLESLSDAVHSRLGLPAMMMTFLATFFNN